VVKVILAQVSINLVPVGVLHIFWINLLISNNTNELGKALSQFLDVVVPAPVTQNK
jgi:hypothetical protein